MWLRLTLGKGYIYSIYTVDPWKLNGLVLEQFKSRPNSSRKKNGLNLEQKCEIRTTHTGGAVRTKTKNLIFMMKRLRDHFIRYFGSVSITQVPSVF